jgi:hypothetical protein
MGFKIPIGWCAPHCSFSPTHLQLHRSTWAALYCRRGWYCQCAALLPPAIQQVAQAPPLSQLLNDTHIGWSQAGADEADDVGVLKPAQELCAGRQQKQGGWARVGEGFLISSCQVCTVEACRQLSHAGSRATSCASYSLVKCAATGKG